MTFAHIRKRSAVLLLALQPLVACRRPAAEPSGITITQQLAPQPPRVGPAAIEIQIADATHKPIAHALIQAEADMSHPGMAPVFGKVEETEPGNYQAHLNFTMAGDWVVLLRIQLPDGQKIERQVDVKSVQSN